MRRLIRDVFVATILCITSTSMAQQWRLQTKLSGNPDLITVRAVSRDVAWFCGNTTVYRTTDAGQHWLPTANVTTTEALSCMGVRDDSTAIIGGGGPNYNGGNVKLYRTTDGGKTWNSVYTAIGAGSFWNGIHFLDAQNGLAWSDPPTGTNFLVVKTADGGATWTATANPPVANTNEYGYFQSSYFYDNLHGWFGTARGGAGAIGGRVFRTEDGGNTWTAANSGNTVVARAVRFVSPLVGIRTSGTAPLLTRSIDGGKTWSPVTNLPIADIRFMLAATAVNTPAQNQLWVYGEAGANFKPFILTSIDGGVTWQEQSVADISGSTFSDMSAVSFGATSDSVQAWAVTFAFTSNSVARGHILNYRQRIGVVTGVQERANIPVEYALSQNYPNPFNPSTTIRYSLAQAGYVSLKIFNLAGQEIATLIDGKQNAGEHHVQWQAGGVPSGVYFYQLRMGGKVGTRKMILMR